MIEYGLEPELSSAEFIDLLIRSTLAERRPVDQPERIERMLRHADLILTARDAGKLVGIARSITDYSYCTYLSDLAVDRVFQARGIGRALIERTRQAAGTEALLILLAAPAAQSYYPHIGMQAHDSCWIWPRESRQ
jgi:GNAT superfamily N-acetyltransferase